MSYDTIIDLDNITLQNCESMFVEGFTAVINDGHVIDFEREEE